GKMPSTKDLNELERFVRRGRATGVFLDGHTQQRDAQSLLDHWAGYLSKYDRDVNSTLEEYDPNQSPDLSGVECPYRGLEAFGANDSRYFFGRERLAQELAERLGRDGFLALVGPSGSGKSSVVFAGIVPILLREGKLRRSLRVVPGTDPISNLAHAIGPLPE